MKIVHMIEDYGILCNEAKNVGKFEAYENYTKKYPAFFSKRIPVFVLSADRKAETDDRTNRF